MEFELINSSEIIDVRDGTHDSPKYLEKGYPLITSKNLKQGKICFEDVSYVSEEDYVNINKRSKVDVGDILYSMIGSIGNYALVEDEPEYAIKNVALFKFKDEKLFNKYFYYLLNSPFIENQIKSQQKGGTQKFVTLKILRNLEIPLPPLPTQKKIAAILDEADTLRQLNKQLIDTYNALTQSIFLDMFVNENKFEMVELVNLVNKITDGTHHTPKYTEQGIPFLRVTDITGSNDSKKFISREEHDALIKRCHPERNDILYTKNGTIGVAKIIDWDYEFSIFVSLCLMKPKHNIINNIYLETFLNTPFALNQALKHSKTGTITNLHLVEIKKMKVPFPPIHLQNQFAERVKLIEAQKAQAHEALQKSEALFNSLLQKAFKGELV